MKFAVFAVAAAAAAGMTFAWKDFENNLNHKNEITLDHLRTVVSNRIPPVMKQSKDFDAMFAIGTEKAHKDADLDTSGGISVEEFKKAMQAKAEAAAAGAKPKMVV